jgi:phage terminase large subunit-like protein
MSEHLPGYDPWSEGEGYYFDENAANIACWFFEKLKLIEGEKAGQPFRLEPWQQAIVGAMYGWRSATTGLRRYREAFVYIPRKNGKSMLAAGLVLVAMFVDKEPGAQIYSAAAEREQAALVFRQAAGMIAREPALAGKCEVRKSMKAIERPETNSIYKALSADADTKHGLGAHMVIVDELHAHPNADLVDVLQTSMGSRREPLLIHITTADYDRPSVCNTKHEYACNVRDGVFKDASFLPVVYEATNEDDWTSPEVWAKVNPNLGVSVRREYLERECQRAQNEPSYENTFKRLHLNIKTQQDVRWIPMDTWDRCSGVPTPSGPCFAGLDLASTTDIAALVLFWPDTGSIVPWFWIPSDNAEKREKRDRVPYLTWGRQGLVTLTPGNVIDYNFIRQQINELADTYEIQKIGYDPWNARHLAQQLQDDDGLPLAEFRQGYISMNEPSKHFERLLTSNDLRHGGNEVLRWMAGNVTVRTDPSGNIKPDKQRSTEKIDGIVAAIMAIGLGMTAEIEETFNPGVA